MSKEIGYLEDRTAYNREKYHEYRLRNMLYVTGGEAPECVHCGAVEDLHFDHIDPSKKSFNVNVMKSLKNPEYRAELEKCQLLCRDCHERKTVRERPEFTHGTIYGFMRAKCDCGPCSEKKREWYDARNARRRKGGARGAYGRPSTHGEYLHYKRGCRCDECRAGNAAYVREAKARKAAELNLAA